MSTTKKKTAKAKSVGGFNLASGKTLKDAWLHLKHHSLRHLLYVGEGVSEDGERGYAKDPQPVRVRVRDNNAPEVEKERRRLVRLATQAAGGKEPNDEAGDEILHNMLKFGILEFENLFDGDWRPLDASSDEDKEAFLAMGNFSEQLLNFTVQRSNFFVKGSKD